jgi:hypothetical protein
MDGHFPVALDEKSGVNREVHAPIRGSPGVRFPRATRLKVARAAAESGIHPDAPLGESERAGLIRLRAESRDDKSAIAELRMQAAFAGRVATWFAKGSQ